MDKKTIKSYIERLKNIEEELNDNDFNENTFSEVNEIMNSLKNLFIPTELCKNNLLITK